MRCLAIALCIGDKGVWVGLVETLYQAPTGLSVWGSRWDEVVIRCAAFRGGEPMASALSVDLRERVVAAIEAGASRREAARRFEVSPASAVRWHGAFVQEGRTQAKPMGGDQRSHAIEAQADLIRLTYEAQPELFLHELRDRRPNEACESESAACPASSSATASRAKNTGHAAEQEREDVKPRAGLGSSASSISTRTGSCSSRDRHQYEDGAAIWAGSTRRTLPGRGPIRAMKTITVTAVLRTSGLMATAVFDGPMTSACFRDYVEQTLVPVLMPGDTVVLDNLQATRSAGSATLRGGGSEAALPAGLIPRLQSQRIRLRQASRPRFEPRPLARSATSGTPSNAPSNSSRYTNPH